MNPKLRSFLLICAKHAVNAVLTNGGLMALFPQIFNFHNHAGQLAVLKAVGLVVGSREAMVWGPKILKWSQTGLETLTSFFLA